MYLRFVVADIDEDSGRELGVFHAIRRLRDEEKLHAHEEELHDSIVQWFDKHLENADSFYSFQAPLLSQEKCGDLMV
jgi:hypothetical protein